LSPGNPALGHGVNVFLFALTGLLLFNTLKLYSKNNILFSFIASMLFIAHPIHTEVVANIKSLDEILALLFTLCSLCYVYHYAHSFKWRELLIAAFLFFCALMSKESAITFVGVFPLAVYLFTDASKKKQLLLFFTFLTIAGIFFFIRKTVTGYTAGETHSGIDNVLVTAPDNIHRFTTAVFIMALYIKLFFFPHPLVSDYSANQLQIVGPGDYRFIVSLTLLLLIFFPAILRFKKNPWLSFGILFFGITASVSSNIFFMIGTAMSERLMYTPSLGWCIVLAYLISKITSEQSNFNSIRAFIKQNRKPVGISLLIVLAFTAKSVSRNTAWKNNYTLFATDVDLSPESARTHYNLGSYIIKEEFLSGKSKSEQDSIIQKGIYELKKSVELYPAYADSWGMLGVIYDRINKPDSALHCYYEALKYNPTDAVVYNNIGALHYKHADYAEAGKAFEKATQLNPNSAVSFTNLGSCYGALSNYDAALTNFNHALQIDPNYSQAYYLTGVVYRLMGKEQQAQFYISKAEELAGQGMSAL
jgi:protein O-mannosyl-transferase